VEERRAPVLITRSDKQRATKLYASLAPGASLGTVAANLTAAVQKAGLLPAGYELRFRGMYERMADAGAAFAEAGLLAVLLTYLTLAAILESFWRPFLILTTIPLSLIGILWALYLTHHTMTIFVMLGAVMLVGIVVNNAVLILDHATALRRKGVDGAEALLEALSGEVRAVLMITLAAILGMLPMAVGGGLGSEMRESIGIASVGGILVSAVLTMIVMPLVYFIFHPLKKEEQEGRQGH